MQINHSSVTRIGPKGGPLIAAGVKSAGESLRKIADIEKFQIEFIELDSIANCVNPSESSRLGQVEFLWCHGRFQGSWVSRALENLTNLRWVHSDFVGVDALDIAEFARREILLTNGGDNFARPMAEWVVLGILASAKCYGRFLRNSDKAIWDDSFTLRELSGLKVLLLGLGSVNSIVAEMLQPFQVEVIASVRHPREILPNGIDRLVVGDEWFGELGSSDYVVLGLPLTKETKSIIGSKALDEMKSDITIINLSRGGLVDENALIGALDADKIRYCLLDAFNIEPLPVESPLWKRQNVVVLPHQSWSSPMVENNTIARMHDQVRRWMTGFPMDDVVDLEAGY